MEIRNRSKIINICIQKWKRKLWPSLAKTGRSCKW